MIFSPTSLPGLYLLEPTVFGDERGFFMETYHQKKFADAGIVAAFVQINHARSVRGTLRGLHFQQPQAQGKLIRCLAGEIFDVAVDIRPGSPTFGKWLGFMLSGENKRQVFIPPDFAHGYCVLSEFADVTYACTEFYAPQHEKGILWNDPTLNIAWPLTDPILSPKDQVLPRWAQLFPA